MRGIFNFVVGAALVVGLDQCADGRVDAIPNIGSEIVDIGNNGVDIATITYNEGAEAFNNTVAWFQRQASVTP